MRIVIRLITALPFALLSSAFACRYVPETRGKTLEEIEAMLKEGRKY